MNRVGSYRSRPLTALAALLAALIAFSGANGVRAADEAITEFGNDYFRYLLNDLKLQPLKSVDELDDPAHSLLIIFGSDTAMLDSEKDQVPRGIKQFVRSGGALFVATDQKTSGLLSSVFGVQIDGTFVTADTRPYHLPGDPTTYFAAYRRSPDCPFMSVRRQETSIFENPKDANGAEGAQLTHIATNRPSFLSSERLPILAGFPFGCDLPGKKQTAWSTFDLALSRRKGIVAGGSVDEGRVLVVADHSIFINEMMGQNDNDNYQFAMNALNWLTDYSERNRVYYIQDGQPVTDFHVDLKTLVAPPIPIGQIVDRFIQGLEEDRFFDQPFARFSVGQIQAGAALLAALGLLVCGMRRLIRGRYQVDADLPLAVTSTTQVIPAVGLVDQRHQTMLEGDNLWEAARDLTRHCFADLGLGQASGETPDNRVRPPRIKVQGGWREHWVLRNLIDRLWGVAHGPPRRITLRQFGRLIHDTNELQDACRRGRIQFDLAEEPV